MGWFPISDHVIFSRELFFYLSKNYSFIYMGLFEFFENFPRVSSHGLKWGNKLSKLKRSKECFLTCTAVPGNYRRSKKDYPKFFIFCYIYRWTLGHGREGGVRVLPERQKGRGVYSKFIGTCILIRTKWAPKPYPNWSSLSLHTYRYKSDIAHRKEHPKGELSYYKAKGSDIHVCFKYFK